MASVFRSGLPSIWRFKTAHYEISAINTNCKTFRHFSKHFKFYSTNLIANASKNPKSLHKDNVRKFIAEFEGLIESRNNTIQQAKRKRTYKPYSKDWKEWAESFYVLKGGLTPACLFSLDALPNLIRNISVSPLSYRRDFVLYKDIPFSDVNMDFKQNFREEYKHIISPTVQLSCDEPLPKDYKSVLPLPEGYYVVLDASSIRIISHVSREELFSSWKLDFIEQEKRVNMLCRRNGEKWMVDLIYRNAKEGK